MMPLDTPTTDAAHVQGYIEDAARWLWRSMECDSSMLRRDFCFKASDALIHAANLAADERLYWTLAGHSRQASTLAEQFYGDGMGVGRLFDELSALPGSEPATAKAERQRAEGRAP